MSEANSWLSSYILPAVIVLSVLNISLSYCWVKTSIEMISHLHFGTYISSYSRSATLSICALFPSSLSHIALGSQCYTLL